MKREFFKGINALAKKMYSIAKDNKIVTAVLFFDETEKLAKELLRKQDVKIHLIELELPCLDMYDKEYYITLNKNDDDKHFELYIEKAFRKQANGYIGASGDIAYLSGDANSKIVNYLDESAEMIEIITEDDCVLDDECNKYDECDRATNNHKRLRFRWKNTPIEVNINPFMYSRFEDGVYIDDLLFW